MKFHPFVYIASLLLLLVPFFSVPIALAGGSSASVYETNIRDKYLVAGKADQLLLSFAVEPGQAAPGYLTVESLSLTCAPSHGFTDLKLVQGDTILSTSNFFSNLNGSQSAYLGASDFPLLGGQATELKLLVTVEQNTNDFITACAIDDMYLKDAATNWSFSSEAQSVDFEGIDRLIYIDDLNDNNQVANYNIFDSNLFPVNLPLNSVHNLLMEFRINAPEDIVIDDLFLYCDAGNIIRNYRLQADDKDFSYTAMQNNGYTNSRPEHSWSDRIVFDNLDVVAGYGQGVTFRLYGDTYDYFSYMPSQEMNCSVIDIKTRVYNNYERITANEASLVINPSSSLTDRLLGQILLQVENNGEAWYLDPVSKQKYYLPDGDVAYQALRNFGLGITDADLLKIPVGLENRFEDLDSDGDGLADKIEEGLKTDPYSSDTDGDGFSDYEEVMLNHNPLGSGILISDDVLVNRLKGRILLQVESKGEAWYINPSDGKRYYMKNGSAAYQIMRFLSLGITNQDIRKIEVGKI